MKFKEFEYTEQKADYLRRTYPFLEVPKLTDVMRCIHCDKTFIVGDFKVLIQKNEEYIVCPNSPECSGSCIDWQYADQESTQLIIQNLINERMSLIEVLEVYLEHVKKDKNQLPDSLKEIHKRMKNTIKEIKQLNQ
jgi:hypothetical protein